MFEDFFKKANEASSKPNGAEKPKVDDEENLTPNQYTEIRNKKLDEMRKQGENPYPHKVCYKINHQV